MSYDLEHVEKECPCPCGKGKIVFGWGTNDWGQIGYGLQEIWCNDCASKYRFDKDGLIPIDFPPYKGDNALFKQILRIENEISGYCDTYGYLKWSADLCKKRIQRYLSKEELNEPNEKKRHDNEFIALCFARYLAHKFSKDELTEAYDEIQRARFSTELVGTAKKIAEGHKYTFKTIKPSNVKHTVEIAIRNYDNYLIAEKEDNEYVEKQKRELEKLKSKYYKDYPEYEKKRLSQLFKYVFKEGAPKG